MDAGAEFHLTGPWPPYTFATFDDGTEAARGAVLQEQPSDA